MLPGTQKKIQFGGEVLDQYLQGLLHANAELSFNHQIRDLNIVHSIKEKSCCFA